MPSVQQPPLWVLGEATCLEKATTAPHAQRECPSNVRQQKPRATCSLAKYSGSHVLSSPIQSLIASTHSFNNKIFEVPLYARHIAHLKLLSWSLQSGVHFPLTDHEDQSHHTFHPCLPATTRSTDPLSRPSPPELISLLFCVSPNLIHFPSLSALTNPLHHSIPSL